MNKQLLSKVTIISLIAMFFTSSDIQAADWDSYAIPANAGSGKVWQLQSNVSDDFNYTFNATSNAATMGNKWTNFYHNSWDGPGTTYWQRNHVSVNGGNLVIKSSRNNSTTKMGVKGVNAGCITSTNKVLYPVFVEAAVSVADIALASDVWLLSPDDTQEIDIIECYGGTGSGNDYFAQFLHISHHSFVRSPFQDYQPKDLNSWWSKSGVNAWGPYCWNNGNRRYVRVGVNWISPKHFEYYVDGQIMRVLYDKAFATKVGNTWYYTYPSMSGGNLQFGSDGYQAVSQHSTSSNYDFNKLQAASNASNTSVIDPYNFQGGNGFTKALDVIINVESQDWHVAAGRTPSDADLNNTAKNTMKVNWIRAYKPVTGSSSSSGGSSSGGSSSGGSSSSSSGATTNLALNKTATQSSNYNSSFPASKAVNGNTGDFNHTKSDANAWWQVDLGSVSNITNIEVYNRTLCCQNRLTNFYVFVSDVPFSSTNLNTTKNQSGVGEYYKSGQAGSPTTVNINRSGRYVRIQLAGTNFLHMAEVKVFGTAGSGSSSSSSSGGSSSGGSSSGGSSSGAGTIVTVQAENFTNTGGTTNDAAWGGPGLGANKAGSVINWVNGGDWMDYTVSVPYTGSYEVEYTIACPNTGSTISISENGSLRNTTTVPNNGSWDNYVSLKASQNINLTAGTRTIRIAAGAQTWTWNLDKFTLKYIGSKNEAEKSIKTELTDISVYPNPATDVLYIDGLSKNFEYAQVVIYNSIGRLVRTEQLSGANHQVSLVDLSSGMYILQIVNNQETITKRFIKE